MNPNRHYYTHGFASNGKGNLESGCFRTVGGHSENMQTLNIGKKNIALINKNYQAFGNPLPCVANFWIITKKNPLNNLVITAWESLWNYEAQSLDENPNP